MFDGQKKIEIQLEQEKSDKSLTLAMLIEELRKNHLREKEEMFV